MTLLLYDLIETIVPIPSFYTYRAISATADADSSTQYNHVVAAINVVSEEQAQLSHAVKAIQNKDRLRDCKAHEEQEGRMNFDMLNRFIVIGLQDQVHQS
jgi:hypothetical protein